MKNLCINKLKSETKQEEDLRLEFKAIKGSGNNKQIQRYPIKLENHK